jgi:hypothetical protein
MGQACACPAMWGGMVLAGFASSDGGGRLAALGEEALETLRRSSPRARQSLSAYTCGGFRAGPCRAPGAFRRDRPTHHRTAPPRSRVSFLPVFRQLLATPSNSAGSSRRRGISPGRWRLSPVDGDDVAFHNSCDLSHPHLVQRTPRAGPPFGLIAVNAADTATANRCT